MERILSERQFSGNHLVTLNYLLEKVRAMVKLRDLCLNFLNMVAGREVSILN